jgi:hypothetical protein
MDEAETSSLISKAKRLEGKLLFVKAGDIYLSVGMKGEAASAYEKGSAFDKAITIFRALGKPKDVKRCEDKRAAGATGQTWQDLQSEFQRDSGNPL